MEKKVRESQEKKDTIVIELTREEAYSLYKAFCRLNQDVAWLCKELSAKKFYRRKPGQIIETKICWVHLCHCMNLAVWTQIKEDLDNLFIFEKGSPDQIPF